ncbi:MAG: hypothetical protein IJ447_06820 [Clostridia bacterium]|nr:hypothetical protein [Clostridia bacterium]
MIENPLEIFSINSKQDIDSFIEHTNGLHDGYIIGVQYEHHGHSGKNPHLINPELSELKIKIMVTSVDTVVELIFQNLLQWQIKDDNYEITDTAISLTDDGLVIWTDDCSTEPDIRKESSYVIAKKMQYRIIPE